MNYDQELGRLILQDEIAAPSDLLSAWKQASLIGEPLDQVLVKRGILSVEQAASYRRRARESVSQNPKGRILNVDSGKELRPTKRRSRMGTAKSVKQKTLVRQFGPYEILEELGQGGMGAVYKARLGPLGEPVALKVLLNSHQANQKSLERFKREMIALRQISHPNVIKLIDEGEHDSKPFIALEFVDGETLRQYIGGGDDREFRPIGKIVNIFIDIGSSLSACHEQGLVHRDLKPTNVMISNESDRVVLIDFGLVRRDSERIDDVLEGLISTLTETGEIVGSPAFMSPEQVKMESLEFNVGAHTDVWGFGATLFFALTAQAPFEKMAQTPLELVFCLLNRAAPSPRSLRSDVPSWLDKLVVCCLAKKPAERPSIEDVIEELKNGQNRSPSSLDWRLVTSVFGLLFGALVLLLYSSWTQGPVELLQLTAPIYSKERDTAVSVVMNRPCELIFESMQTDSPKTRKLKTDSRGLLKERIRLVEGRNRFRLYAERFEFEKTFEIQLDTKKPKLNFEGMMETVIVIKGNNSVVRGQVLDSSPVRLFFNGEELQLRAEGRFAYKISGFENTGQYKVEARDRAGQVTDMLVNVLSKTHADKLCVETLSDLRLWAESPSWLRRFIVWKVGTTLGAGYEYDSLSWFRRGSQRFQLAAFYHKETGILLRLLPGGQYTMGSAKGDVWEKPAHRVRVAPLLMGVYEVSQSEWDQLGGVDRRKWKGPRLPIEMVSWNDIKVWLKRSKSSLRLPSEGEWEYAARSNTRTMFYWGEKIDSRYSWYRKNSEQRTRERSNLNTIDRMNAFGLEDMLGNVWEWCEDTWLATYRSGPATGAPRVVADRNEKVLRGGSWFNKGKELRVCHRYAYPATTRYGNLGFRVCMSVQLK
jgi:serine/threonine protein kinase/formylglycine-generating enzyme required for sulfatase activity